MQFHKSIGTNVQSGKPKFLNLIYSFLFHTSEALLSGLGNWRYYHSILVIYFWMLSFNFKSFSSISLFSCLRHECGSIDLGGLQFRSFMVSSKRHSTDIDNSCSFSSLLYTGIPKADVPDTSDGFRCDVTEGDVCHSFNRVPLRFTDKNILNKSDMPK